MNQRLFSAFVAVLLLFSPTVYAQSPAQEVSPNIPHSTVGSKSTRKCPCKKLLHKFLQHFICPRHKRKHARRQSDCKHCNNKDKSQHPKPGKTRRKTNESNEKTLKAIIKLLGKYSDQLPPRLKLELFQILGNRFADSSVAKKELKALKIRAKKHFDEACNLRDRREYSKAIVQFNQAIELFPEYADAFYQRGVCQLKIGGFIPGMLDLSRALELEPRYADQFYNKVYQVSYVVDLERVMKALNKVVKERPNVSYVVFLRGFFYVAKSEFKGAQPSDVDSGIADFNRCLELNPAHVAAKTYRGLLFFKKRQYDKAHNDFDHAISGYPKSGITHYLKALTFAAQSGGATGAQKLELQEKSIRFLRQALDYKFGGIARIKKDKHFQNLNGNQKYHELLKKFER